MRQLPIEYCDNCGQPTGRAGRWEDSLYITMEKGEFGPLCEECFEILCQELEERGMKYEVES